MKNTIHNLIAIIFFAIVIGSTMHILCNKSNTINKKEDTHNYLIESQFSGWNGEHKELTRFIKSLMNDPESYEHIETTYIDKGDYLIITCNFRGKNAFGGVVKSKVVAKCDFYGNVIKIIQQ